MDVEKAGVRKCPGFEMPQWIPFLIGYYPLSTWFHSDVASPLYSTLEFHHYTFKKEVH